jgi:Spy/CpxP family protein refolding chaperone
MTNKRLAIVTVLSLAALVAIAAGARVARVYAQGDHMGFGGGQHMLEHLTDTLDLSDQQQQSIKIILANEKTTVQPLMQQLSDAHQQIRAATDAGTLTQEQALSIIDSHKDAFAQLLVAKAKTHQQIMGVLTPAQQDKFKKMQARHQQHMQHWMGQQKPSAQ